jgi:alpha-glucosidase (family GH31 glycosyl hydrolase)
MHETTSFGLWDKSKYPDPSALMRHFHDEGLKTILGLRITFITNGPYSEEGVRKEFFIMKDGNAQVLEADGRSPLTTYSTHIMRRHSIGIWDW